MDSKPGCGSYLLLGFAVPFAVIGLLFILGAPSFELRLGDQIVGVALTPAATATARATATVPPTVTATVPPTVTPRPTATATALPTIIVARASSNEPDAVPTPEQSRDGILDQMRTYLALAALMLSAAIVVAGLLIRRVFGQPEVVVVEYDPAEET